jgi:hypothetical protein
MWGEVRLGSNTVRNTTGVIEIDGTEVVGLELGNDKKALLDIDVYGSGGAHLAKLRKNSWVFGDKAKFDLVRTADHVKMTEKETGRVVLDAALGAQTIKVAAADLYGPKGFHIRIDPDGTLYLGTNRFVRNTFDGAGKAFVVGSTGR